MNDVASAYLQTIIRRALRTKEATQTVFLDASSAFDLTRVEATNTMLKRLGTPDELIKKANTMLKHLGTPDELIKKANAMLKHLGTPDELIKKANTMVKHLGTPDELIKKSKYNVEAPLNT